MEFLVTMQVNPPPDLDPQLLRDLMAAESSRAAELAAEGTLVRLWRVPGRFANVGVWLAPDATALHAAITSLPMHRFLDVRVEALAEHPNDPRAIRAQSKAESSTTHEDF